jgi:hypothetical protein
LFDDVDLGKSNTAILIARFLVAAREGNDLQGGSTLRGATLEQLECGFHNYGMSPCVKVNEGWKV